MTEGKSVKYENVFGWEYEKLTDRETRKSMGMFYTPDFIIDYIIKETVSKADILKNPYVKILDPACGAGYFLIKAYDVLRDKFMENLRFLREAYGEKTYYIEEDNNFCNGNIAGRRSINERKVTGADYWKKENINYHILRNCLYGADLDPIAVDITKNNLTKKASKKIDLSSNIVQCDSLLKWEESIIKEEFNGINHILNLNNRQHDNTGSIDNIEEIERLVKFWSNKFDYIIGNPPYVVMLKSELNECYWNYILNKYNTVGYKKNVFYLFIERSLEKLKLGGVHGFIIPDRYFFANSYVKSRSNLVRNTKILNITQLSSKVFKDATVGTAVYIVKNSEYEDNHKITLKLDYIDESNFSCCQINQKGVEKDEKYVINILTKSSYRDIIEKIKANSLGLKDYCSIHVGMMIKDKEKNFRKAHNRKDKHRIVLGRDLGQYIIENDERYCFLDGANIFGGTKKIEKHQVYPKILLRKTGSNIVASIDNKGFFAEQSVYMIIPFDEDKVYGLLGQIQSQLTDFYFKRMLITNPESYPYIQHYDLMKIPIHRETLYDNSYLKLIKRIIKLKENIKNISFQHLIYKSNPTDILNEYRTIKEEEKKLKIELSKCIKSSDEILYRAYGLTVEEIELIKNSDTKVTTEKYCVDRDNSEYYKALVSEICKNIREKSIEFLSRKGQYSYIIELEKELYRELPNMDMLIAILKEYRFNKKKGSIIGQVLNIYSDNWGKYVKGKSLNKKELVRYSKNQYGLAIWPEEVHNIWFKDRGRKNK